MSSTLATRTAAQDKAVDAITEKVTKARAALALHLYSNATEISGALMPTGPSGTAGRKTKALSLVWAEWSEAYAHHAMPSNRVRDIAAACFIIASKPLTKASAEEKVEYATRCLAFVATADARAVVAAAQAKGDPIKAGEAAKREAAKSSGKGKGRGASRTPGGKSKSSESSKSSVTPPTPEQVLAAGVDAFAQAIKAFMDVRASVKDVPMTSEQRTRIESMLKVLNAA